jgi:hypothetical protein
MSSQKEGGRVDIIEDEPLTIDWMHIWAERAPLCHVQMCYEPAVVE